MNLTGTFLRAASAPIPPARKSAIVNITSTRAFMSEPNNEAYSASKGGIVALTHALANRLGPDMRVNAIAPGWIATDAWNVRSERKQPRAATRSITSSTRSVASGARRRRGDGGVSGVERGRVRDRPGLHHRRRDDEEDDLRGVSYEADAGSRAHARPSSTGRSLDRLHAAPLMTRAVDAAEQNRCRGSIVSPSASAIRAQASPSAFGPTGAQPR